MHSSRAIEIKEIDEQIQILRNRRYELEKLEISEFKQDARKNIGRCFKVNGQYVKVIDIPQEEQTLNGTIFNQYQYPALYLAENASEPFYVETLFSAAWGVGNDTANQYEEISPKEFELAFRKKVDELCKL